ncbi:MAG: acyl carrier protein [Alphaproteobacteria bacterium]|nr:acyl carrier protein [Alphaproteobacteria bacterium]MBV8549052.1 acyl carrier protein [Alphaproteobacteria bacterium]
MTQDDIISKLTTVFREVFEDPALNLTPDMTAKDVTKWDSLSHVDMIVSVEETFGIRLSTREVANLQNVGELISAIGAKAK